MTSTGTWFSNSGRDKLFFVRVEPDGKVVWCGEEHTSVLEEDGGWSRRVISTHVFIGNLAEFHLGSVPPPIRLPRRQPRPSALRYLYVQGNWFDLPRGLTMRQGSLTALGDINNESMTLTEETGGFPETDWVSVSPWRDSPALAGPVPDFVTPAAFWEIDKRNWSADVTGLWLGNDGGSYYVRQVEDRVVWLGELFDSGFDMTGLASISHIFDGQREGDRITGTFLDLPSRGVSLRSETPITVDIDPSGGVMSSRDFGPSPTRWTRARALEAELRLDQLDVLRTTRGAGDDDPRLLMTFFKVDGETIDANQLSTSTPFVTGLYERRWFRGISENDTPLPIGRQFRRSVRTIRGVSPSAADDAITATTVGVIVAGIEEDESSLAARSNVMFVFADAVQEALRTLVRTRLSPILSSGTGLTPETDALAESLESLLQRAIDEDREVLGWFRDAITNSDDIMDTGVVALPLIRAERSITINLRGLGGHWQINGLAALRFPGTPMLGVPPGERDYRFVKIEGYVFRPDKPAPAGTISLGRWFDDNRGDSWVTSNPAYTAGPMRTLSPDYWFVGNEGFIFDPTAPRPDGTLPLRNWYSQGRNDNWTTANPRYVEGPMRELSPDYMLPRRELEGFVFDPRQPQPPDTVPLLSWYSPSRGDNLITIQTFWRPF